MPYVSFIETRAHPIDDADLSPSDPPLMSVRATHPGPAYPAVAAACAVAIGVLVAGRSGMVVRDWSVVLLVTAVSLAGCRGCAPLRRRTTPYRALLLTVGAFVATACAGGIRYATYYDLRPDTMVLRRLYGDEVHLSGRITDSPSYASGSVRFVMRLEGAGPPVNVLVQGRSPPTGPLSRCDEVRVSGRLDGLPRRRNPGSFDYGRYLMRRRIYARLFLSDGEVRPSGVHRSGPMCAAEPARGLVRDRLERYVSAASSRAVLEALILGDRRTLDPTVRDRFARLGLLHLLAVSGLHVMVVGMLSYRLLGPILNRLQMSWRTADTVRATATAALLLGYMLLTGCSPSVVRAVVMALLFLASTTLQRPPRPVNTLGAAVFVLLFERPAHLFEPGFQLSVSAVGAILTLLPQLTTWMPAPRLGVLRDVHGAASATVAATIGTLPVLLYHFGQVGLAGLVLNLPAIPLTTAALAAGMAAVVLGGAAEPVGAALGASANLMSGALLQLAAFGDRYLTWSVIRLRVEEPSFLAALALVVASIAVWRASGLRWRCLILALAVVTAHVDVGALRGRYRPHLDLIFLDVGQGDASILLLPDGGAVLVDAGPRLPFSDAGADVIVPQLNRLGITRLSTVLISHPDSDHLGGLPAVLRSVEVGRVVRSGVTHDTRIFAETNQLLDSLRVHQQTLRAGDTLAFSPTVRGYVLHPPENTYGASANDRSLAVLVRFGEVNVLLMGDAPVAAELDVVRRYGDHLRSHVLKVGHHGSRTSSSAAFLQRVSPRGETERYAVVSVARKNRFGLPDDEVLARLRRAGFRLALTSEDGASWFRTDGRAIERVSW